MPEQSRAPGRPSWLRRITPALILYAAVVFAGIYGFAELAEEVYEGEGFWFDRTLLTFVAEQRREALDVFFRAVTLAGSFYVLAPVAVITVTVLLRRRKRTAAALLGFGFGGHSVFARISPEQKLDLINLYQESGWVVGMTGDGVNDAPALKKADIGISMGKRGTEVAREAADMVLKDDAFATILVAIGHGRTIFQNIRRFIIYLLSGNLGEIMAISAAALVAAPLPMLPLQILYINFVSDVMPALALGLSRSETGVMRQPPRDPKEPILQRRHWLAIGGYGALIAASALGAFATALLWLEMETSHAVTISFLTFGFARLWHVFNMRSADSQLLTNEITSNGFVWISIVIGIVLLLAAAYIPVIAEVLSVHAPGGEGWLLSLSFSVLPLIIVQLMKISHVLWEKTPDEDQ